jgi:hypothetical protein
MPDFHTLISTLLGYSSGVSPAELFAKTDPAIDGDDCLHDCDSCTVQYPKSFKVETNHALYGNIKGWSTHLLVATSKSDWARNVANEKGSIMEAVHKAREPRNGVSLDFIRDKNVLISLFLLLQGSLSLYNHRIGDW